MKHDGAAAFTGLIDLAAAELGGRVLEVNDEYFAEAHRMLEPGRGVFLPDEYTDRGKWMDGWESRRKRVPGHDQCTIALGSAGVIRGLDIDTNHFLGNHAPFASLEAAASEDGPWTEVLPQVPLRPGSQNLFAVQDSASYAFVRLHIYPDGGVARLRVYGDVTPDPERADPPCEETLDHLGDESALDLAAVKNGGLALACSDMFFGPMNNLIAPGRSVNMGGGWETRRRRSPTFLAESDWILLRLGGRGSVSLLEIDTNHFKGNYADRFSLMGIDAEPSARITDLLVSEAWRPVMPETKLSAHARHFYAKELSERGPFTHLRLFIYPDGGISRLRAWGTLA